MPFRRLIFTSAQSSRRRSQSTSRREKNCQPYIRANSPRSRTNDPCWDHWNDERRARANEKLEKLGLTGDPRFVIRPENRFSDLTDHDSRREASLHLDFFPQIGRDVEVFAFNNSWLTFFKATTVDRFELQNFLFSLHRIFQQILFPLLRELAFFEACSRAALACRQPRTRSRLIRQRAPARFRPPWAQALQ